MSLDANDVISLALLLAGALLTSSGLWLVGRAIWRREDSGQVATDAAGAKTRSAAPITFSRGALAGALGLAVVSMALGLEGIERRGMTHVEVFVPGIELPDDISVPPARTSLKSAVMWHLLQEPHPPGYYLGMWGWTKVFGTSLTALRLPSVLFGGLAVFLIFGLATRVGRSTAVGLTAAALLALNGHHIFWTQHARMYGLALLLSVASTWAWVEILAAPRKRPGVELAYIGSTVLGLYCHTLMWPVLALQWLFTLTRRPGPDSLRSHPLTLQAVCVILGAPMLAHALYIGQDIGSGGAAALPFVQDFLTFGFLFTPDDLSIPPRDIALGPELLFTAVSVLCLAAFVLASPLRARGAAPSEPAPPPLSLRSLTLLALGVALVHYAVSREAYQRQALIALTGLVPLLAVAHLAVLDRLPGLRRHAHPERPDPGWWTPMMAVGLGSFGLIFALSMFKPVMVSRALLLLVPALLVILAAGLVALTRRSRLVGLVAITVVAGAHLWSVAYYRAYPGPNDYRGAAEQLLTRLEGDEPVFVVRHWSQTPLFYHMPDDFGRLVGADYAEVTRDPEVDRVWVARVSDTPFDPGIVAALTDFAPVDSVSTLRTRFLLFERR